MDNLSVAAAITAPPAITGLFSWGTLTLIGLLSMVIGGIYGMVRKDGTVIAIILLAGGGLMTCVFGPLALNDLGHPHTKTETTVQHESDSERLRRVYDVRVTESQAERLLEGDTVRVGATEYHMINLDTDDPELVVSGTNTDSKDN